MAQQRVRIVTDSTADLSNPQKYGLEMIPSTSTSVTNYIKIRWILSPEQFYEKLRTAKILPRTSQPSPGEFMELYKKSQTKGRKPSFPFICLRNCLWHLSICQWLLHHCQIWTSK